MQIIYSVGAKLKGGGFGNTAYYGALGLEKAGFLMKVLAMGSGEQIEIPTHKIKNLNLAQRFDGFPLLKDNLFDLSASRFVKDCDFLHVWAGFGLFSMLKAKKKGIKIVLDRASSHILWQKEILEREYKKWNVNGFSISSLLVQKQLMEYKLADYIFVPSPFAFESFIKKGFSPDKLRLIPFGVDLDKFKPQEKSDKYPEFTVVFVGQISIRKGVQYLLEAWQRLNLNEAKLILVGKISTDFQKIWSRYQNNPTIEHQEFCDPLSYYQKSDLFVFPSLEEGSALVTYEAMACGLPLIVTHESGSIVEDQREGLIIKSGDVNDLAQKLEYFYQYRDSVLQMGKMAQEKIKNYTWDNYGERVAETYEDI